MESISPLPKQSLHCIANAVCDMQSVVYYFSPFLGYLFDMPSLLPFLQACIGAARNRDGDGTDKSAGAIRGRCTRVCEVVDQEMLAYQPGPYVDRVNEAVTVLRDRVILCLFGEFFQGMKMGCCC